MSLLSLVTIYNLIEIAKSRRKRKGGEDDDIINIIRLILIDRQKIKRAIAALRLPDISSE